MKKYVGLILVGSLTTVCFSADLSRYQNSRDIEVIKVTQPAIVQISNLDSANVYVVANDKGEAVEQQFYTTRKVTIIPPQAVEACLSSCQGAPALADNDRNSTFDFPITSTGYSRGKIKITYTKPLETDRIVFETTRDSYMPSAFTLTIDGKRILNTIQGSSAKFPKMMATTVEVEFDYNQPIRFTEVGVGTNKEEEINNMIRFVYQPGASYTLYVGTTIGRENVPAPPINLFAKNKEAELVVKSLEKNSLYKEQEPEKDKDFDEDGVVDLLDNCPQQMNKDQNDGNGNGIGDTCDDYDYDGVETYRDNCPFISNTDQRDTDRDKLGDACDQEESRFTEKHGWVPWVVFGIVLLAVMGMGYEVIRKKR